MKKTVLFTLLLLTILTLAVSADEMPMRGIWVSTVYNLDFPAKQTTSSEDLKTEIDEIVRNISEMGFNAVFLQVRPSGDAIYPSEIYPWSKYLTGTQGTAPDKNFDPLEYWIDKCHEYSVELHAWINPYRITKDKDKEFETLSENNPAVLNPGWVVKYSDGNYYYNPAVPEVRELVVGGVKEILKNYDVDGIHMDDYFYPGTDFDDEEEYEKYNKGVFSDVGDWRRNNVNLLVKSLYETVKNSGKDVVFGISPSGIWANKAQNELGSDTRGKSSYYEMYADTRKWVKENMVDYLAPQIYWEFGYSVADYEVLFKRWADVFKESRAKLYIGLADYRSIDASDTSPWYNGAEIIRQMDYNYKSADVDGEIHFRYKMINQSVDLKRIITEKYKETILVFANGKRVVFDTYPVLVSDRTMVPMRAIFEALGAKILWNDETKTVTAQIGDEIIELSIGSDYMTKGNEKIIFDSAAFIENDRTYVPLRAVSEAFDYNVMWNADTKTVIINKTE